MIPLVRAGITLPSELPNDTPPVAEQEAGRQKAEAAAQGSVN